MRFGLALPHYDFSLPGRPSVTWDELAKVAVDAETLGFSSLWVSDHIVFDLAKYGGSPEERETFEWVTTLGALSMVTNEVRLGVLVSCTPLRSAAITAKSVATLDQLSNGRIDLGLGAGWYERDFELAGMEFPPAARRIENLVSSTREIRGLLDGSAGAPLTPSPIQRPSPSIVFGAKGGRRMLDAVADVADGWNTAWSVTPEGYEHLLASLDVACEAHGRDPESISKSIGLTTLVGRDGADLAARLEEIERQTWPLPRGALDELRESRLAGTPGEVARRVKAFAKLGVEEIICCFGPAPFMVTSTDNIAYFAESVIAALSTG